MAWENGIAEALAPSSEEQRSEHQSSVLGGPVTHLKKKKKKTHAYASHSCGVQIHTIFAVQKHIGRERNHQEGESAV